MPPIADRQGEEGNSAIKINEAPVVDVSFRPSLHGDERGRFKERDLPCSVSRFERSLSSWKQGDEVGSQADPDVGSMCVGGVR